MTYLDILNGLPVPEKRAKSISELMKIGLGVLDLAATERIEELHFDEVKRGRKISLPRASWECRRAETLHFSVVDKRAYDGGVLVTAHADTAKDGLAAIQAFVVNDMFAYRGFGRVIRQGFPSDQIEGLAQLLHQSTERLEVPSKPNDIQVDLYNAVMATVPGLASSVK